MMTKKKILIGSIFAALLMVSMPLISALGTTPVSTSTTTKNVQSVEPTKPLPILHNVGVKVFANGNPVPNVKVHVYYCRSALFGLIDWDKHYDGTWPTDANGQLLVLGGVSGGVFFGHKVIFEVDDPIYGAGSVSRYISIFDSHDVYAILILHPKEG